MKINIDTIVHQNLYPPTPRKKPKSNSTISLSQYSKAS